MDLKTVIDSTLGRGVLCDVNHICLGPDNIANAVGPLSPRGINSLLVGEESEVTSPDVLACFLVGISIVRVKSFG